MPRWAWAVLGAARRATAPRRPRSRCLPADKSAADEGGGGEGEGAEQEPAAGANPEGRRARGDARVLEEATPPRRHRRAMRRPDEPRRLRRDVRACDLDPSTTSREEDCRRGVRAAFGSATASAGSSTRSSAASTVALSVLSILRGAQLHCAAACRTASRRPPTAASTSTSRWKVKQLAAATALDGYSVDRTRDASRSSTASGARARPWPPREKRARHEFVAGSDCAAAGFGTQLHLTAAALCRGGAARRQARAGHAAAPAHTLRQPPRAAQLLRARASARRARRELREATTRAHLPRRWRPSCKHAFALAVQAARSTRSTRPHGARRRRRGAARRRLRAAGTTCQRHRTALARWRDAGAWLSVGLPRPLAAPPRLAVATTSWRGCSPTHPTRLPTCRHAPLAAAPPAAAMAPPGRRARAAVSRVPTTMPSSQS